jgi:uncharacterized protein YciI
MKLIYLIAILFLFSSHLKAQSLEKADSLYIVTYTTGPSWDVSKKPNEQSYFKEHSSNLSRWRKEGIIKVGGRYKEKGVLIIKVSSLLAAKALVENDEGVIHKLFVADVQSFNVFYQGCTN